MSRLRGFAAAGLQIPTIKPATFVRYGQLPCLVLASPLILIAILITNFTASPFKLPPRKPDLTLQDTVVSDDGLAPRQTELYRDIFRLQAAGAMRDADKLITRLTDPSLLGHVLAQRYLHTSYRASFEELRAWLSAYADHPESPRIARLAGARAQPGQSVGYVAVPPPGIEELEEPGMAAKTYRPDIDRTDAQEQEAAALLRAVRTHTQRYEPSAALRVFNDSPVAAYLDAVEKDRIRAIIAAGYFYAGKNGEAVRLSGQALRGSRAKAPLAGWVNGLAQWQVRNFDDAAKSFEVAANSDYSSGWMKSAASYWAARAHLAGGHSRRAGHWYRKAAEFPRTFYGLLAIQSLGQRPDIDWNAPELTPAQEREILATKAGRRAEKLLAAGEIILAEAEIRNLYVRGDHDRKRALLAYSYDRNLPSLTLRLGHALTKDRIDAALYPAMPWTPNKGFRIDRALMHAIVRQESRFNAAAENRVSGATGLMQLMPNTAFHVSKADIYRDAGGRSLLKSPQHSLDLGQDYVEELLNNPQVGQDLLSLAIAYNAGPGKLAKWKAERTGMSDPLLFLESLPYAETRNYVARVMANYWIYRMRFDQPNESMQALAEGNWARYAAYDKDAVRFADAR